MSFSPEHPDPACPDCHGAGTVRPSWIPDDHVIERAPCARCKAREYDAWCPEVGRLEVQTPGHPCDVCREPAHPPAPTCRHGRVVGCETCDALGPIERDLYAAIARAERAEAALRRVADAPFYGRAEDCVVVLANLIDMAREVLVAASGEERR